jgi:hypothetical protein
MSGAPTQVAWYATRRWNAPCIYAQGVPTYNANKKGERVILTHPPFGMLFAFTPLPALA